MDVISNMMQQQRPSGPSLTCTTAGAGKSSLVAALLRLTETRAGAILLDGRDCRTVPLQTLRRAIGVVPQTPFLFQVQIVYSLPCCHSIWASHATRLSLLDSWRIIVCGLTKSDRKMAHWYMLWFLPCSSEMVQRCPDWQQSMYSLLVESLITTHMGSRNKWVTNSNSICHLG